MIVFVLGSFGIGIVAAELQEELAIQEQEGECISRLINQGVERRDIATKGGECWAEPNGYYK